MDGFHLFKDVAAFLSSLVCANLPAMLQMPDLHFINYLLKDGENSEHAWVNIRDGEKDSRELEKEGLSLS